MDKTIGIAAIIALAAIEVRVETKDTSHMVAASVSENDQAVAKVVQTSGVKSAQCCKNWADVGKGSALVWLCSDTGYDPSRIAWLDKVGAGMQCVVMEPSEDKDGNVKVAVTLQPGEPRAKPEEVKAEEAKRAEAAEELKP